MSLELTILVDDAVADPSLQAQHGLCILARGPDRMILLDAAADETALTHNTERLDLPLGLVDAVVVSHGHSDHTGALAALATAKAGGMDMYVHRSTFNRRWYDKGDSSLRDASCPHTASRLEDAGARLHWVGAPEMLSSWLILSGPIGGPPSGDDNFIVKRGEELVVDNFEDEMFMLLRGRRGWVVVTGCCHRGLKNTLRCAKFLAHDEPIAAIVGGLHLHEASQAQLEEATELLRGQGSIDLYPCHCTGTRAVEFLRASLAGQVHMIGAGSKIIL